VNALRGVDLVIDRGEMLSSRPERIGKDDVVAASRSAGYPSTGLIRFGGRSLENESDRILTEIRSREIVRVQQFNLIPT